MTMEQPEDPQGAPESVAAPGSGRRRLAWYPLWLGLGWLMIAVVILLSLTTVPIPSGLFEFQDKAEHLVAYFSMVGWFVQLSERRRHLAIAVLLVALGIGLEFLQALTPDRAFEYADMAANTTGALLAFALARTSFADILTWFERRVLGLAPPVP